MIDIGNPAGGLALLGVAVLVLLLRLRRRARPVVVPSLLLWRRLSPSPLERRRIRPDRHFWLQVAVVIAITAGLLHPSVHDPGGAESGTPLAIVVDCSASMGAVDGDTSRLGRAVARAWAAVEALPATVSAMVVTATARPRVVVPWTTDRAATRRVLFDLRESHTRDALAPAVQRALAEARAVGGGRVLVVSDGGPDRHRIPASIRPAVEWIAVGRPGDNLALTALEVDQPPFGGPASATATVTVRSFATSPRTVRLRATVNGRSWAHRELMLEPEAVEAVVLAAPPGDGLVEVALEGSNDALGADDRAFGWIGSERPLDLLAVTDDDATAEALRGLAAAVPGGRIEIVNRAGWSERGAAIGGQVLVFDRFTPPEPLPRAPALYLAPQPDNGACPGGAGSGRAVVVDWDDTHPVLVGLEGPAAIEVGQALSLDTPPSSRVLVRAATDRDTLPLLVATETAGHRLACLAAELPVPLATSDELPLVVLLLNTLRWLAEDGAGQPLVVRSGEARRLAGPVSPLGADLRHAGDVVAADRVGIQYLRTADGAERLLLANLLDELESDTRHGASGLWTAKGAPPRAPVGSASTPLAPWCWAIAIVLLAIERIAGRDRG